MGLNINPNKIKDPDVREALQRIKEALDTDTMSQGTWAFFETTVPAAVTALKYPHHLKFTPQDVIQLSVTNGATVTWIYASFDSVNIVLTTSGACKVRAYVGKHREGS